jgi:hypothetical protein
VQELQERDLISCTNFCCEFLTCVDKDEVHNLFVSDEAHFHLSGFVNKQNFHHWANENPPTTASETITKCKSYSVV